MASQTPWNNNKNGRKYRVSSREQSPLFLIVCEGQTEQLYFQSFRVLTLTVETIINNGTSLALVEAAIKRKGNGEYHEVWCVFDFDVNPALVDQKQDFNRAIAWANQKSIKCAYSNDSFELWYVLHFNYTDQQLHRSDYYQILSTQWDINYKDDGKKERFAKKTYNRLKDDPMACQDKAIARAKKLHDKHNGKEYHLQNPTSTVYQLVEALNIHLSR